jgi:hypothetical protein
VPDAVPTIDPVAQALLAKAAQNLPGGSFPAAAGPSATVNATALSTVAINQYNARIDHTFSTSDSVFVRGSIFDDHEFDPFGSGALNETLLPGFGYNLRTHTDNLSATWTHDFNTSWLNELRFGWMWVGGGQTSPNAGTNFAGPTGLQGVSGNPLDTGFPDVTITGFTTMGESTQYVTRKDNDYEIYDNVIWHHGTHTVKFGGYFFHLDFEPVNAVNARGTFQFTPTTMAGATFGTGNALGNFLFGYPTQGSGSSEGRGNLLGSTDWVHLYVEDAWQITPSLKLDIGLRYEFNRNVTDANNNMSARGSFRRRLLPCSATFLPDLAIRLPRRPDGTTVCFRGVRCASRLASVLRGPCRITKPSSAPDSEFTRIRQRTTSFKTPR